jgi:hypothetical protein
MGRFIEESVVMTPIRVTSRESGHIGLGYRMREFAASLRDKSNAE